MHDIWNPWHGCVKCSEGCLNCYMYTLDRWNGKDGSKIYRVKSKFNYPLHKSRNRQYKIQSGEMIRVCMTSDFFLEEADCWREEAWEIMKIRSDVIFFLLTKRPQRVEKCLPKDWGNGWENIFFNVTCENQKRAEQRLPILLELPFLHKGVMCAPLIGEIRLDPYLKDGQIEQVICGGENYENPRPCDFAWVRRISNDCKQADVTFCFIETGTKFIKDGTLFTLPNKRIESEMAWKAGVNHMGKPAQFMLKDAFGRELTKAERYVPRYKESCFRCGSKPICNGCSDCGKCKGELR